MTTTPRQPLFCAHADTNGDPGRCACGQQLADVGPATRHRPGANRAPNPSGSSSPNDTAASQSASGHDIFRPATRWLPTCGSPPTIVSLTAGCCAPNRRFTTRNRPCWDRPGGGPPAGR